MHTLYVNPSMKDYQPDWIPCPCCGYRTITSAWEDCCICRWETSSEDWDADFNVDPESWGENWYSIREAQVNFRLFGASAETWAIPGRVIGKAGSPTEQDVRTRDWREFPPPLKGNQFHDPDFPVWDLACPCCGYITIHGGRERCEICGWFFCPQQQNPDAKQGSNEVSLRQAQRNYVDFGAKSQLLKPHVRLAGPNDRKDRMWRPVSRREHPKLSESTCRCCGYKTIRNQGDECSICGWIAVADPIDPDEKNASNGMTLRQAQRGFHNQGATSGPAMSRVRRPTADDERDSNWWAEDDPLPTATNSFIRVGCSVFLDVACACCGYKAVLAANWRCEICGWEYYTAHQNPADRSQPNPVKLRQAQRNYGEFGASRAELLPREIVLKTVDVGTSLYTIHSLRKPLPEDQKDPEWKPLDELDENNDQ